MTDPKSSNSLSPVTRAVLDSVTLTRYDVPAYAAPASTDQIAADVAAALWALVRQLLPDEKEPRGSRIAWKQRLLTRAQIQAIIYELKNFSHEQLNDD